MSDAAVAAAIASGKIPEGITEEFLNESKNQPAIIAIVVVTVLTSLVVLCRLASRAFVIKRIGIDDGLALGSLSCFIAFVGLCIELIKLGSGRHFVYVENVLSNETQLRTQVLDFVAHILYTVALLLCRVSGLAFYHRLCNMHDRFKLMIQIVFGILIAGFLPQILLLIFHCRPVTGYWPYDSQPESKRYECLQWGLVYSVNSAVSLLCDLLIFGIPIVMLWSLEMSRKKKIQLGSILLPGTLVIAISVTRLVLVIRGQWQEDMSWEYNPMLGVEVAEIGATLIALSVPGVKPVFDRFVLGKKDTSDAYGSTGQRKHNGTTDSGATKLGTLRLRSQHLGSREDINQPNYATAVSAGHAPSTDDFHSTKSTDGIYVKVDFDVDDGQAHAR
ncbi:integral membrane protein pth11 [Cordyceps javanica]|uniref:Integral membrane protein pth11 n=1 Tax=Cordyceps javanica TaxID=43265 RepID=A0A545UXC1_9HYPO|nr:integral membrane protein pth11 [Cordyceps javanica]TQW06001.1 integral membrane protein pth11 [Cordyceps javanica]